MAAPMRNIVLFMLKSPFISTKPSSRIHPFICTPISRNFAATPVHMVRAVRGSSVKVQSNHEDNRRRGRGGRNDGGETTHPVMPVNSLDTFREITSGVANQSKTTETLSRQKTMKDYEPETKEGAFKFKYEKASADDKRIGRLMMLVKSRKHRERTGRVMLEGRRLITDAIESGLQAHTIFFSRVENLEGIPVHKTRATFIKVPFQDIIMWSDVVTSQGVIGVFRKPTHENLLQSESSVLPLTLICDNVREPGNLGTILRSAVAAQCEKILLTKGCVDLWEPKVLRSGAGAHFHKPIIANISWKEVPNHLDADIPVHVADNNISRAEYSVANSKQRKHPPEELIQRRKNKHLREDRNHLVIPPVIESKIYHQINWRVKSALVIGGETEGLSDSALEMCDHSLGYRVHIPMAEAVDSLNAAVSASVILFEALRQNLGTEKN